MISIPYIFLYHIYFYTTIVLVLLQVRPAMKFLIFVTFYRCMRNILEFSRHIWSMMFISLLFNLQFWISRIMVGYCCSEKFTTEQNYQTNDVHVLYELFIHVDSFFKLEHNDMDSLGPCISIFFSESNSAVTLPVSTVSSKSCVMCNIIYLEIRAQS